MKSPRAINTVDSTLSVVMQMDTHITQCMATTAKQANMFSTRSTLRLIKWQLAEPSVWGYNRATLLMWGYTNMETWPSKLGVSWIWDSKIWLWIPWDSDLRITVLAGTSSSCKLQTRPVVRDGTPHQQICNCPTVIKFGRRTQMGARHQETSQLTLNHNFDLGYLSQSLWLDAWARVAMFCSDL
jgi:hypothetical protein